MSAETIFLFPRRVKTYEIRVGTSFIPRVSLAFCVRKVMRPRRETFRGGGARGSAVLPIPESFPIFCPGMELLRALAVLAEPPTAETRRVAEALGLGAGARADEYTELFVFQLYPYASVYLGREGMLGGEARDRVGGFWRALG